MNIREIINMAWHGAGISAGYDFWYYIIGKPSKASVLMALILMAFCAYMKEAFYDD